MVIARRSREGRKRGYLMYTVSVFKEKGVLEMDDGNG